MTFKLICLPLLVLGLSLTPLAAQQSSKSKSKDRFREKTEIGNLRVYSANAINTEGSDNCPAFFQNGIVYTPGLVMQMPLQYSMLDVSGLPSAPFRFDVKVNFPLSLQAASFSRDGQTAFFTCAVMPQSATDFSGMKYRIYTAQRAAKGWAELVELPINGDGFSCLHASLSADGRTLYFASDRPGGYGGMDIWKAELGADGAWGEPVNLGNAVNTDKNEDFPFISLENVLYFSSNGRPAASGGYDIFSFDPTSSAPAVVNLGEPFNTRDDDFGFILSDDGAYGFFVSNRPGGMGMTDIYSFSIAK
ncbi:MAG: PD40 domain-containing protein [Saprospiraceae bacterium]|nr:PD40 domain-containing protein [Saprospiraceae bacterium]